MAKRPYILGFLLLACSVQAATVSIPLNSFNAGELSPLMSARSDFTKYNNGCRLLRNMFVLSQGPVSRRPGTKYIADAEDPNVVARLIPFEYSRTDSYAMEFGDNIIRFYRNGGQILDDDDAIYELPTVFEEDELPKLQFTQLADVMYIVSGTDPPQKLSRFGHSYWTIADVDYTDGPFLEEYTAPETAFGSEEDYASDEFGSTAIELSSTNGTASGAVANTNDNDDASYRKRQAHNTKKEFGLYYTAWTYFTIEIPFNSTADNIERVTYKIGWYNGGGEDNIIHNVSCKIHYATADTWTEISTDIDENVEIGGNWDDVNGIKLYIYNRSNFVLNDAYAGVYIYEIEAWGTQVSDTASINYIKSSNTATYDRTLDAAVAVNINGVVRIPSTAHGFLAGDYVTLSGTTEYDGTYPITNVDSVDTFDIEVDYNSETFSITDTAISRVLIYTMKDTFAPGHIGALWKIRHPRTDATESGTFTGDSSSSVKGIACEGDYKLTTHGTWTGTIALEKSRDGGTNWEIIPASSRSSVDDDNISYAGDEPDPGYNYRVTMSNYSGAGSATYTFVVYDHMHTGVIRITDYIDANDVTAEILTTLNSVDKTTYHSEGYWSDKRGWPQTIEDHEYRLWYGGSKSYPQTVWSSKTVEYEEMLEGTDDDDALTYILHGQNPIQFLHSYDYLIIGTLGGVGRMGDAEEPMTPTTSPQYRQQTPYGSAFIPAVSAGDAVLYIGRGGDKVREFAYSLERDRFVSPDMTILSEHLTKGIVEIAYQIRPDSVLWCVLDTGDIATMTYQRENDVFAWSLQVTDGDFESVAIISGDDEDEVWVIVNRTIDGATARYIEQIQPRDWGTDDTDAWFVDSGLNFDGGDSVIISGATKTNPCVITVSTWPTEGDGTDLADDDQIKILAVSGMTELNGNIYTVDDADSSALTFSLNNSGNTANIDSSGYTIYTSGGTAQRVEKDFTNLSHLEGETVVIFADGAARTIKTVSSNAIEISNWRNKVLIGLPYTSIVETMPLVINTQKGSTSANYKKIINVSFDFYETLGLSFGTDASNLTTKDFDDNYNGWKQYSFSYGRMRPATVYVQTSKPVPLTIRQIIPEIEIYD